jgi:hypothetical protein
VDGLFGLLRNQLDDKIHILVDIAALIRFLKGFCKTVKANRSSYSLRYCDFSSGWPLIWETRSRDSGDGAWVRLGKYGVGCRTTLADLLPGGPLAPDYLYASSDRACHRRDKTVVGCCQHCPLSGKTISTAPARRTTGYRLNLPETGRHALA